MITINVGGREYDSWEALPEDVRAQLLAAGVDPGPDGRLDSLDLARAGGALTRRTVVTGPDGAPLPPVVAQVLTSIADAVGSALRGDDVQIAPGSGTRLGAEPESPSAPPALSAPQAPVTPVTAAGLPVVERPAVEADTEDAQDDDASAPAGSRRVPRVLAWVVIAGTVLLVATVVVIGLSGV